jgi:hypothetical protein
MTVLQSNVLFNWNASVTGNKKRDGWLSSEQTKAKVNCKLLSRYQYFTFIPQCSELLAPTETSSGTGDYVLFEQYKAGIRSNPPGKSKVHEATLCFLYDKRHLFAITVYFLRQQVFVLLCNIPMSLITKYIPPIRKQRMYRFKKLS